MGPPPGANVVETELGQYWFDEEGILNSLSKSPLRTLENTRKNFEIIRHMSGHRRVCLLVHLSRSARPDKATLTYVAGQLPTVYKAMAMVSDSNIGSLIMNLLFRFNAPSIPMKSFSTEVQARQWLRQYL